MYVPTKDAIKYYKVSDNALRTWANNGKIKYIKTKGGHRRYFIDDGKENTTLACERQKIIYARVSSRKQQNDLERQSEYLKTKYPDYTPSQTLDQVSILKERDSKGFWKESSKAISKKLWLPTKTDLQGLDLHYLNGFSNNTMQSSFVIQQPKKMSNEVVRRPHGYHHCLLG